MRRFLLGISQENTLSNEISLTLLRVFTGLTMAIAHGLGKLPPSEKFLESVEAMGFPLPGFFGWAAGLSEFAGGLLLAFGLFTRPAAAFIAITMTVAALGRHAPDPFKTKELSLLYLIVALVFVARGASRYSVDRLLHAKVSKPTKAKSPKPNTKK